MTASMTCLLIVSEFLLTRFYLDLSRFTDLSLRCCCYYLEGTCQSECYTELKCFFFSLALKTRNSSRQRPVCYLQCTNQFHAGLHPDTDYKSFKRLMEAHFLHQIWGECVMAGVVICISLRKSNLISRVMLVMHVNGRCKSDMDDAKVD